LAEKKADPDARAAALRLYVIAAHLDPDKLGRSSLLGMTALARTPQEERRIRAMSYLLDPAHDASALKQETRVTVAASDDEAAARESLLSMVRSLRRGQASIARRQAERKEAAPLFEKFGRGMTQQEFLALCRAAPPLPPDRLARLIRWELALEGAATEEAKSPSELPSWSSAIATGDDKPIRPLTLETLTEFDPRLSIYRDGKWVTP
jgi:hypothetical protein